MIETIQLLYRLKALNISLWLENQTINYELPKNIQNKEIILNEIRNNKNNIIWLLKQHSCFDNKTFKDSIFAINSLIAPLSFAQERLWFIEQYEGGTNAYNISMIFSLSPKVDLDILEQAIHSTVLRHEILHSLIKTDSNGNGYQEVINVSQIQLIINRHTIGCKIELANLINQEINHIYILDREYPIRVSIYSNGTLSYLGIIVHHIAFDGWSIDVFRHDLQTYYNYYLEQKLGKIVQLNLPELLITYKDYAVWQKSYLSGNLLTKQLSYWSNHLGGYESLNLPLDKPRPTQINYAGADIFFVIDSTTSASLRELAKQLHVSLFSLLLSGYYILLSSYSNQDDIVIGTPVANRHFQQLQYLVGFFVNTLPLRSQLNTTQNITEYIQDISQHVIEAQLHQDLPFEKLVEELKIIQDTSRNPIFQVMFVVQNFGSQTPEEESQLTLLKPYDENIEYKARFDLTTMIDDSQEELRGRFIYATSLFNRITIEQMSDTYKLILKQISNLSINSVTKIKDISYLNPQDYDKVIKKWNLSEHGYSHNKTLHQFFEEQVAITPDNVAIVYEDTQLTYQELNQRSNQLAHYLRMNYKIQGDNLIALCLDRSEYMLIAILGTLKSGAAYVPMDPNYPDERIKFILEDTQSNVVLTNEVYQKKLNSITTDFVKRLISIDSLVTQQLLDNELVTNLPNNISSTNLAYVIYTSGTTGKPKGVALQHQGIVNRIQWMNNMYPLNNKDKILQKTPYVFDVSVWELLWANWYGASIIFAKAEGHKDVNYLIKLIEKNNISIVHFVPSMLEVFNQTLADIYDSEHVNLKSLRYVFCSGEALMPHSVKSLHKLLPKVKLHNLYGPTEASVDVLYYDCNDSKLESVYIGKPISNTTAYILNNDLKPLPIGSISELYIGGVGLARGYLNQPELTTEKFITNPFQSQEERQNNRNSRLYKTGDLARYMPDGNIEYIGRNDFQVKIRGFRVELGEIESKLLAYPCIKQAVVLVMEHNTRSLDTMSGVDNRQTNISKYLVGYYVADSQLDEMAILIDLSLHLPDYMVPNILVHLESLPLTINGKLDLKALPDPEFTSTDIYIAPRNDLEAKVCKIYAEVLGLDATKVGIQDSFFRLGGDSIVSIQLVSKLRQKLDITISVKDIFTHKNIKHLVDNVINRLSDKCSINIMREQGILEGNVPLLPIQQWFWSGVKNLLYLKPNHWNQSFLIRVPELDIELLKLSIIKLVEYHDSFRLAFTTDKTSIDPNIIQQFYMNNAVEPELKVLNLNSFANSSRVNTKFIEDDQIFETKIQAVLTTWQSNFDLNSGNAYCAGYIYGYADKSARVFFALHHLLVDAVSWRIITHDLQMLYTKLLESRQSNILDKVVEQTSEELLEAKGTSYRQWAIVISNYALEHTLEHEYWNRVMDDYPTSKLTLAKLIENETSTNRTSISLNTSYTRKLLTQSNQAHNTQINDLLLTALVYALDKLAGGKIHHITLEGHGREELVNESVDITHTVGWFTSMYPVRLEVVHIEQRLNSSISNEIMYKSLEQSIKHIKENLRIIPNKGIGYGALVGYINQEMPRISFNYLGQFDKSKSNNSEVWDIIVGESSGVNIDQANHDTNIININGLVINGKLSFHIIGKLSQRNINKFADTFKIWLEKIIDYTTHKVTALLTANRMATFPSQARYLASESTYYNYYNTIFAVKINNIDILRLKSAYYKVKQKYDILNATFHKNADRSWSLSFNKYKTAETVFEIFNLNENENDDAIQNIINSCHNKIDIENGKTIIAGVVQAKDRDIFFILVNHIVMDRYSLDLILEDINFFYMNFDNAEITSLTHPKASYKDILIACNNYLNYNNLPPILSYWEKIYECKDSVPVDNNVHFKASDLKIIDPIMVLNKAEYLLIMEKLAHNNNNLLYSLLIYGIYKSLCSVFSVTDFILNTIHNGRNSEFYNVDTSLVVGWMSCTIPIRLNIFKHATLVEGVNRVNDIILEAPDFGLSHGILEYMYNKENNIIKKLDKINVEFNFMGNLTQGHANSIYDYNHIVCNGLNRHNESTPEYSLYLAGSQNQNGVYLYITYSDKSYNSETIEKLKTELVGFFQQAKETLL